MKPTLPEAHVAQVLLFYSYEKLKIGDIVVFYDYTTGNYVLHRLVAKQGRNFITQGDNPKTNPVSDRAWLTPDNFVGLYVGPTNSK